MSRVQDIQLLNNWKRYTLQKMLDENIIISHLDGNHGELYPRKEEFVKTGVPYLSANCIENGKIDISKAKYLSHGRAKLFNKGIAKNGDVLFAHNATVGPVSVLETDLEFVILSTTLTYYRCNIKYLIPQYLRLYMLSDFFVQQYSEVMRQATRNQVPIGKQRTFVHLIPPIEDQKRIVAILDETFTAIDKAEANLRRNLQNSKELFESYLLNVFTSPNKYWKKKTLGELSERVSVGHVGPTSQFYCAPSDGVPFLRSQNVRSGYLDWKGVQYITKEFHRSLRKSQLKLGDILFVRVGANRGDCCVVKENVSELNCANIVFARLKEGNVDFIDRFCQSPMGREQLLNMSVGAAQGVINTKSVADLIIPYPPMSEQQNIVDKLTMVHNETKRLQNIYQKKLTDLDKLKKSILQKAFAGELTEKHFSNEHQAF